MSFNCLAGQERYRSLAKVHYRDADGVILVFDITKRKSFESCIDWLEDMQENGCTDAQLLILGNKLDLVQMDPQMRAIQPEEVLQLAESFNGTYQEVSAVTHNNLEESFHLLLDKIYREKNKFVQDTTGIPIDQSYYQKQKPSEDCC